MSFQKYQGNVFLKKFTRIQITTTPTMIQLSKGFIHFTTLSWAHFLGHVSLKVLWGKWTASAEPWNWPRQLQNERSVLERARNCRRWDTSSSVGGRISGVWGGWFRRALVWKCLSLSVSHSLSGQWDIVRTPLHSQWQPSQTGTGVHTEWRGGEWDF